MTREPLGTGSDGQPVYLKDLWPSPAEIAAATAQAVRPEMFRQRYSNAFTANETWNQITVSESELFPWDPNSTYIQEPPFLLDLDAEPKPIRPIRGARVLAALGDSVTTDHISPAGSIAGDSPAGKYLEEHGVGRVDFNSYGSRRGNDRVMARGTFANIRIRNQLAPGSEGGVTRHLPDGQLMPIYDAAMKYKAEGVPLLVLAGAEYGTGSSRDWAAKGPICWAFGQCSLSSFERIHRSNLVGMGILPLQFSPGQSWETLGLTGEEIFDIADLSDALQPGSELTVHATAADGSRKRVSRQSPHRHAGGTRLLPQRRHPADRIAQAPPRVSGPTATNQGFGGGRMEVGRGGEGIFRFRIV